MMQDNMKRGEIKVVTAILASASTGRPCALE
jgi:hypothetical protein